MNELLRRSTLVISQALASNPYNIDKSFYDYQIISFGQGRLKGGGWATGAMSPLANENKKNTLVRIE